ncbi:MAG: ABC transporter ATP-binding protein/permease [Bacteroidales bacterium]|nr:ABC transporter ATP-binding protein/permease [Lachnoclostridium sp.]MCM1383282.1 ABC transporter ATP-binding protein/permease [Lachnoclostridium sp.]MCM1465770.1 ABC transporter ATP-binding protein/permease [Bacteroidales bacterium]
MKQIIVHYLKPYFPRMGVGFLIKFVGTIMDLCIPYILAYIIDSVIPLKQKKLIFAWGILMIVCSVLALVFNIIANRMASKVAGDATEQIRNDLFQKMMHLSNRQTDSFTKPSLISRMTTDTYNIHQMIGRIQRLGVRAPILLAGGICVTFALDAPMASVLLATVPALTVITVIVYKKSISMYADLQNAIDRFVRMVREDIAGIRVIKALSKTEYESEKFNGINREVVGRERKNGMVMAVINPSMNMLLNLGMVAVILVGAFRVQAGNTEVGKILAFTTYFTIILNAVMSISKMFTVLSKSIASGDRIWQVLCCEADMEIWEERYGDANEGTPYEIEFDHVTFSYGKNNELTRKVNIRDLSFRIKKGETLGIIGEIGSGKSTVLNLLMRIYDADKGKVLIGGRDVRSYDRHSLREKFGVVFQNDTLFEDSISENVSLGRNLTEEDIQNALFYARAGEFVEKRDGKEKEGLNIKGANLSGGQKQRVLIARALAGRPDILVLDDSSSALDYRTDAQMRRGIKEYLKMTTMVIVAQRISSVKDADHILVLEEGRAIGYGTHEELLAGCQVYREISKSQMGEGTGNEQ